MKKLSLIILALIFSTSSGSTMAQIGGLHLGILAPSSEMSDTYAAGISFTGDLEIPLTSSLSLTVETAVRSWAYQDEVGADEGDQADTYSVGGGTKFFLLEPLFIGADAMYMFGDFSEFSIKPNVGLRFGKLNIEAVASISEPVTFIGLEVGYFFLKN